MDVKSTGISLLLSWVKYSYYYFIIFAGKISKMRISILISSIAFLFLLSCQTNSTNESTSEVTIKVPSLIPLEMWLSLEQKTPVLKLQ